MKNGSYLMSKFISLQYTNYQTFIFMTIIKSIALATFLTLHTTYSSASERNEFTIAPDSLTHPTTIKAPIADSIINFGKLFLNTPYRFGSSGSDTFDCSGFTSYVYRNFGYQLKRSSAEQAEQFDTVKKNEIKKGDLVYFSGSSRSKRVGHVGIVVNAKEDGTFDFIHAATRKGVTISSSEESYYARRYVKANRVVGINDLLAVKTAANDNITNNIEVDPIVPIANPKSVQKTKKIIPAEYHRVKKGETLSSIAEKYGISIAELRDKNGIKGSKLKLKQQLKVKDQETILLVEPINSLATNTNNETANPHNTEISTSENESDNLSITHVVKKGETLFSIANTYKLSVDELEKINNLKSNSIKFGQKIKISKSDITKSETPKATNQESAKKTALYKIKKGETLLSIAKDNNLSLEEIKAINGFKTSKIIVGQEIKLADITKSPSNEIASKDASSISHKVQSGESLYTIAKKYNTSMDEIKRINNLDATKIKAGQVLKVGEVFANRTTTTKKDKTPITHKVKAGDSFFSLAKKYGCSVDEIKEWNKKPTNKLNSGEKLIIYSKNS